MRVCSIPGCTKPYLCKGVCRYHYYVANKETADAQAKAWQKANPEKVKASSRKVRLARDKAKEAARVAEYRRKNPEAARAAYKRYAQNHRDERLIATKNYRVKLEGNGGHHTMQDIQEMYVRYDWKCQRPGCGKDQRDLPRDQRSIDHIIPVTKGGPDWAWNLRPLCRTCNSSLGNRMLW